MVTFSQIIHFRSISLNIAEIANAWFDAENAAKKAYLLLSEALDKELSCACVRVNQRNLVPFTIETIGWNIGSGKVLKIHASVLTSRETGENLLLGVFSDSEERKLKETLLRAFTEELVRMVDLFKTFSCIVITEGKSNNAE